MIDEADATAGGKRVTIILHRAAYLRELLADVPQERMHATKKLDKVDQNHDGSITLHFTDGTTHECNILFDADGIHSSVRKLILGDGDPPLSLGIPAPGPSITLKPHAKARASIDEGPVDIEDAREYMWIEDGTYLMHNVLNEGQLVRFIIASNDKDAEGSDRWHRIASSEDIKKLYQYWPSHLNKAVNEV
ncbi:hypothetical protein DL771_009631 [Monosporascus sp. 5C6A]|nr:hypothetical protein DL771_009631 [Monosporascus sp. 5C6A]